uniref:STAC3-related SH3 domain-containing protein n=1 Tax=Meloidogyne enterolobii TaxID=390850 RepID=A0A6V7VFZ2_MELEN|nr:unnamed protein product [Meloidogyne enterolobii]
MEIQKYLFINQQNNLTKNNFYLKSNSQQLIIKNEDEENNRRFHYRNRFASYGGKQLIEQNVRKHSVAALIYNKRSQQQPQIIRAESQEGGLEMFLRQQKQKNNNFSKISNQQMCSSHPSLINNFFNQQKQQNNTPLFQPKLHRRQLPKALNMGGFNGSPVGYSSPGGSSSNNSPLGSPKCLQQRKLQSSSSRHSSPANSISGSPSLNQQQQFYFHPSTSNTQPPPTNRQLPEIFSSQNQIQELKKRHFSCCPPNFDYFSVQNNNFNCVGGTEFQNIIKPPNSIKRPNIPLRRCPQSDLASRFQKHHYHYGHHHGGAEAGGSRGSSFSSSTESTPTRCLAIQLDGTETEIVDPVYLALKQATCRYGSNGSPLDINGGGSKTGSRRGSQSALAIANNNINNGSTQLLFESCTPSPRNLSQTSLQDSGYAGGGGNGLLGCGSRSLLVSGSTPQLHGIGNGSVVGTTTNNNNISINCQQQLSPATKQRVQQQQQTNNTQNGGGRRPKLSEKMKSLSLDCADMPPPVQMGGIGRNQYFKGKQLRSARGYAASGESFENSFERSESPPSSRPTPTKTTQQLTRRLPPAPPMTAPIQQQPIKPNESASSRRLMPPISTHIVIHEYVNGECALFLGDRLVVLDNGDPDWKHGFKVNDRLQQLFTFPSTCITAFQPDEQPMRLTQNCNLVEQKLRLYRDQVVFVQPNSLREDGRVNVRNEHGTCAYCPLQYLMLM